MTEVKLSAHAKDMLAERNILEEWVWRTINTPKTKKVRSNGNTHYT